MGSSAALLLLLGLGALMGLGIAVVCWMRPGDAIAVRLDVRLRGDVVEARVMNESGGVGSDVEYELRVVGWPSGTSSVLETGKRWAEWFPIPVPLNRDVGLQAVTTGMNPCRSPLRFIGSLGGLQASAEIAEDLRFPLDGAPVTVRPFDGRAWVAVMLEGTGLVLQRDLGTSLLPGGGGWYLSRDERLLNSNPPCLVLSGGTIIALEEQLDMEPRSAATRLFRALPTPVRITASRTKQGAEGTRTVVATPRRILTFDGADWGAGGILDPVEFRDIGPDGPSGPIVNCATTSSGNGGRRRVYRAPGQRTLEVIEGDDGGVVEVRREGGPYWRIEASIDRETIRTTVSGRHEDEGVNAIVHEFRAEKTGRLIEVHLAGTERFRVAYDDRGRVSEVSRNSGGRWLMSYGPAEGSRTMMDPLGSRTDFRFAIDGTCLTIERDGSPTLSRSRGTDGRIREERRPGGVTTFEYDPNGSVRAVSRQVGGECGDAGCQGHDPSTPR